MANSYQDAKTPHEQLEALYARTNAYVILHEGKPVARIVFRSTDTGSRLSVYAQVWGTATVRVDVKGYGYDRATAGAARAFQKIWDTLQAVEGRKLTGMEAASYAATLGLSGLSEDGQRWDDQMRARGFIVQYVI